MKSVGNTFPNKHLIWTRLVALAEEQHGLVTTSQALRLGFTSARLLTSAEAGRLRHERHGLYALPATPRTHKQALMGACLLSGPVSGVSHRSAAWVWGFDSADREILEISTARQCRIGGVLVHRVRNLDGQGTIVSRRGLPVTNVSRTLLDLAGVCNEEQLEIAVDHALSKRLIHIDRFSAYIDEHGRHRHGIGTLGRVVRSFGIGSGDSGFETKLRRALRKAEVPHPVFQHRVYDGIGYVGRLDAAWPDRLLGIEADSFDWHGKRGRWKKDLRKRNRLVALGWRIWHITPEDLTTNFQATVELLRRELGPTPLFVEKSL